MEKIVTYRANDGEEFRTEDDCKDYENSLDITKNTDILMLTGNLKKVTGDSVSAMRFVTYLFFKNKNSVLSYNKCARYFGYTTVDDDCFGMWLEYDETLDVWDTIDRKIDKLIELKKRLYKAKDDVDRNNCKNVTK